MANNVYRYLVTRVAVSVVLLFLILTFLFILFRSLPGTYADVLVAEGIPPDDARALEEQWGLHDPLYIQYYRYIVNFIMLDPGISFASGRPVTDVVRMPLLHSALLVGPAITFVYVAGAIAGVVFGSKKGTPLDKFGALPAIFTGMIPEFFTSILLLVIFASWLGWFPSFGMLQAETYRLYSDAPWWRRYLTLDFAHHYILPFSAIVLRFLYFPTLLMRTETVENLNSPHMAYHRMKGLPAFNRYKHLAKNSILPIITMYPLSLTQAIGGLVLVEVVFSWPGMGFLLVESVFSRDYPVVQFVFFLIAAAIVVSNVVVDFVYTLIDPRIEID